jgi:GT2 family glycosyltransferase
LRLSVAIVTFRTGRAVLEGCLRSLARSASQARAAGLLDGVELFLVDNGPPRFGSSLDTAALAQWPAALGTPQIVSGHGNVGYGKANNLVLERLRSDAHVVMNPDVELEPGTIAAALAALRDNPDVGLVAPAAFDARGGSRHLCKRYPSLWVLFLRGFAPAAMRRRFGETLARYEMRDLAGDAFVRDIPLASGSFLVVRTELFRRIGGFDERYFMYFEDYDLSLRLARCATLAYDPRARIVHHGGDAAAKGLRHVFWFARSALRFFSSHGWKIA